jgi:hypothetical protein
MQIVTRSAWIRIIIYFVIVGVGVGIYYFASSTPLAKIIYNKIISHKDTQAYFIQGIAYGDNKKCESKGGKYFMHSFGGSCELSSLDAGKKCTFDEDCEKVCLYNDGGAQSGKCGAYTSREDGKTACHRPKKNDSLRRSGEIVCDSSIT